MSLLTRFPKVVFTVLYVLLFALNSFAVTPAPTFTSSPKTSATKSVAFADTVRVSSVEKMRDITFTPSTLPAWLSGTSQTIVADFAGTGVAGSANGTALSATFNRPSAIAVTKTGIVYVWSVLNYKIRKIDTDGTVSDFVGTGSSGDVNGTGSGASFSVVSALAVDNDGNLYVASGSRATIRKVTPAGVVTNFAGTINSPGNTDGALGTGLLNQPLGMVYDSSTNKLYVADGNNGKVRIVDMNGTISTFATVTGSNAKDICRGSDGTLYLSYPGENIIRKITTGGTVSIYAGAIGVNTSVDGANSTARIGQPWGMVMDGNDNIYVWDDWNYYLKKITATTTTTYSGTGATGSTNGLVSAASYNMFTSKMAMGTDGRILVCDQLNHKIRVIRMPEYKLAGTPTAIGSYPVTVTASQGGTVATQSYTITVPGISQTITFSSPTDQEYGTADFTPIASASSSLPLTFSSSNTAVATIVSGKVHIVGAGTTTLTASQGGDATYDPAADVSVSFTVTPRATAITGLSGINRDYDATKTAFVTGTAALTRILSADSGNLSLSGTPLYSFADSSVGTGKTITTTGYILSGSAANNYSLTQPTLSATITQKPLTVTGYTAQDKVYNATKSASITGSGALVGVETVDNATVSLQGSPTGLFSDSSAGTDKSVTCSGLSLSGSGAGNYTLTQPSLTASITPKELSVAGFTAENKTYDATKSSSITGSGNLVGLETADNGSVTLQGSPIGLFADSTVGTAITVTCTGLTLTGSGATNYSLLQPTFSADITPKGLTITGLTGHSDVYDGTIYGHVTGTPTLFGVEAGDIADLSLSGTPVYEFASPEVGTAKTLTTSGFTLSGAAAGNYTLTQPIFTADIMPKTLTVTADNDNKIVGEADPVLSFTYDGFVSGEDASNLTTVPTISRASGEAAGNYTITVSGGVATNYTFIYINGTFTINAPAAVAQTISFTNPGTKTYGDADFNLSASASSSLPITFTSSDNEVATISGTTVHILKEGTTTITASQPGNAAYLPADDVAYGIYIQPKTVTISSISGGTKVYDGTNVATIVGTPTLVGLLAVDSGHVDVAPGASLLFPDSSVGTSLPITATFTMSGVEAHNYMLTQPTTLEGSITPKELTITGLSAANKVYNANKNTTALGTPALIGIEAVDNGKVSLSGSASCTFSDSSVGTAKPVAVNGYTLSGDGAGNYTLLQPTLSADITAKPLSVIGFVAEDKVYDATSVASIIGVGALIGVETADNGDVDVQGAPAGQFADASVGTAKDVSCTGLTLSGSGAGNYSLAQPTLSAKITPKSLTVAGLVGDDKVYDGTRTAMATGISTLSGIESIDSGSLSLTGTPTFSFADSSVGTAKSISCTGLTISGSGAVNYSLILPTLSADITKKTLTITGLTGVNRVYNGTKVATATGTAALNGIESVDSGSVSVAGSPVFSFVDSSVGIGKSIATSGLFLAGSGAGNYTLTQPTLFADISPKSLTVSGVTGVDRVYNATNIATVSGTEILSGVETVDISTVTLGGTPVYRFANSSVGTSKSITCTGLTVSGSGTSNYILIQPTLVANITAKLLTITAQDTSKVEGDLDPALTVTYSGFVTGEDSSNLSTLPTITRAPGESVSTYAITAFGAVGTNYSFSYIPGVFTINLPVAISSKGKVAESLGRVGVYVIGNPVKASARSATIMVDYPVAATIKITILDALGNILDSQEEVYQGTAGIYRFSWDLMSNQGVRVEAGTYLVIAEITEVATGKRSAFRTMLGLQK